MEDSVQQNGGDRDQRGMFNMTLSAGEISSPATPTVSMRPATLGELFVDQYTPMLRVAYLLTGSEAIGEDVVQDAFASMHRRFDTIETPAAYLRTAVVNGAKKHHRKRAREAAKLPLFANDGVANSEMEILTDAIAKLPYAQRTAIVLRYYSELSDEEIGDALNCRPATVRSHLHRGIAALKEVIER